MYLLFIHKDQLIAITNDKFVFFGKDLKILEREIENFEKTLATKQKHVHIVNEAQNKWIEDRIQDYAKNTSFNNLIIHLHDKYGLVIDETEKSQFKSLISLFSTKVEQFKRETLEWKTKSNKANNLFISIYDLCIRFKNIQEASIEILGRNVKISVWTMMKKCYFLTEVNILYFMRLLIYECSLGILTNQNFYSIFN